jgi:hypothetical protein
VLHVFFGESTDSRPSCELNLQAEELEPVGHERDVNLVHVTCDTIKVETSTRRANLLMLKFGSSSMASKIAGSISKTRSLREHPKSCVEGLNVPWSLSRWKMFVNVRALGIIRLENISMCKLVLIKACPYTISASSALVIVINVISPGTHSLQYEFDV